MKTMVSEKLVGPDDLPVELLKLGLQQDRMSVVPVRVPSLSRTQHCHGVEIKKE